MFHRRRPPHTIAHRYHRRTPLPHRQYRCRRILKRSAPQVASTYSPLLTDTTMSSRRRIRGCHHRTFRPRPKRDCRKAPPQEKHRAHLVFDKYSLLPARTTMSSRRRIHDCRHHTFLRRLTHRCHTMTIPLNMPAPGNRIDNRLRPDMTTSNRRRIRYCHRRTSLHRLWHCYRTIQARKTRRHPNTQGSVNDKTSAQIKSVSLKSSPLKKLQP